MTFGISKITLKDFGNLKKIGSFKTIFSDLLGVRLMKTLVILLFLVTLDKIDFVTTDKNSMVQ